VLPKKKRAVLPTQYRRALDKIAPEAVDFIPALCEPERALEQTNDSFFNAERIIGHFARLDPLGEDKVVSKAVGDISVRLFSKEEDPAARTATVLVLQKVSAADDSSDEDDGDDYPSSSTSSRFPPWRIFSA
jgi:hypothetical protein